MAELDYILNKTFDEIRQCPKYLLKGKKLAKPPIFFNKKPYF